MLTNMRQLRFADIILVKGAERAAKNVKRTQLVLFILLHYTILFNFFKVRI